MELIGLDSNLQTVKMLRCTNIQWNRRYYECGDYQLEMLASDFDPTIAYIYADERPEVGIVQKIETEHNIKGDFVLLSGFFLEGMLNWKALKTKWSVDGNLSAACRTKAGALLTDIPKLSVPAATNLGGDATFEAQGDWFGDIAYAELKKQELGQRIRYDYDTDSLYYEIWQGLNRTQAQSDNSFAVFSQSFGTVDGMKLTTDDSNYRNYAYILYDGGTRTIDLRADPTTEPARELYVDTGMSKEDGQTTAKFLAAVDSEARTQLDEYAKVINIDADVIQRNYRYLTDYDLGDKCDVQDDRLKLAFETRIIEINEVWKENQHTASLQFGDKIPTIYQKGGR